MISCFVVSKKLAFNNLELMPQAVLSVIDRLDLPAEVCQITQHKWVYHYPE